MRTRGSRIVLSGAACVALLLAAACAHPTGSGPSPHAAAPPGTRPATGEAAGMAPRGRPVGAPGGAVSSAEAAATRAGIEILGAGGSAADAAVAVALALAVVHPQAGNLGGGGFAITRMEGTITALDFRETAPAAATRDMFLGPDGKAREDASWVGPLAAGVPGSAAGLHELHRRHGVLPWPRVVEPALRLARDGFVVTPRLRDAIEWAADLLARFPETTGVWLPGGRPPQTGTVLKLPELAATLAAYSSRGSEAVMTGPVATAIEAASRKHGGILTETDLRTYRPVWRDPLRFRAYGWEIASMPLPASGGIILAETLGILERLRWEEQGPGAGRAHLLAETWRRAYADRFVLGDPARTLAGPHELLDAVWLQARAAGIDRDRATPSSRIRPWPGERLREDAATTHLSVVDREGNMTALTTTINGWFGCGLYVPGAGFFLNNEMDDFVTAPGMPNYFGLVQGEGNAVVPGARMLSSMTPTLAWRGAEGIALGSPGGSRIPTATAQVLLSLVVDRVTLQDAIDRPRIHHQWLPDRIAAEPGALDASTRAALAALGHEIQETDQIGEVSAVRRFADGRVEAAADARGPGVAALEHP